ncbi:unnamed protein product [Paramecium sonneborni]|uniref:Mannosyl-oligosaccharide glucosidase n=1 Tax=Paramecium sonneborni TaxID=65129 RepID=A0A8S1QCY3_9CILI|nr:unnamed protein product [Paramecium sonneborni]
MFIIFLVQLISAQVNPLLYKWGTYKPQLIHAITERNMQTFNPLTITFYYFMNNNIRWEKSIKYKINERGNDEPTYYQYLYHDGERYAIHETIDGEYKVRFTNEFYKVNPEKIEDWVTTVVNNDALVGDDEYVSLVYSIAIEKLNQEKTDLRKLQVEEEGDSLKITITTAQQVNYIYVALESNGKQININQNDNFGYSLQFQNPTLNYNLRTLLYSELRKTKEQIPFKFNKTVDQEQGNIVFVQYVAKRNELFKFQLRYMQREISVSSDYFFDARILKKLDNMNFFSQFNRTFNKIQIKNPFYLSCSISSFANLIGGFATSFGNIECEEANPICQQQKMMFTPTPSRFGFPRPFLWDDGFHNMIICRWKSQLCIQSLLDWFDTMSSNGWIPREQARSPEQKTAVPQAFLAQKQSETNPPTFIFNFLYLDSLKNGEIQQQVRKLYTKAIDWYHFWIKSQGVNEGDNILLFKWWGLNDNINFGSGMDDWPRSHNGLKSKYNIDASMWGWLFADSMQKLAAIYDPQKSNQFHQTAEMIKKSIYKYHFDPDDKIFKDVLIDESFSPHLGYPNLFPIAFGFIDPTKTDILDAYVSMIKKELWTNHGLRSLSINDNHFGKGDNYWTGPVWIPINYLILRGIQKYYSNHKGLMDIYKELRENLMNTVCINWRDRGYFFEHYNQKQDGLGRGYHPFNGWTSTITLIIHEIYD